MSQPPFLERSWKFEINVLCGIRLYEAKSITQPRDYCTLDLFRSPPCHPQMFIHKTRTMLWSIILHVYFVLTLSADFSESDWGPERALTSSRHTSTTSLTGRKRNHKGTLEKTKIFLFIYWATILIHVLIQVPFKSPAIPPALQPLF